MHQKLQYLYYCVCEWLEIDTHQHICELAPRLLIPIEETKRIHGYHFGGVCFRLATQIKETLR